MIQISEQDKPDERSFDARYNFKQCEKCGQLRYIGHVCQCDGGPSLKDGLRQSAARGLAAIIDKVAERTKTNERSE